MKIKSLLPESIISLLRENILSIRTASIRATVKEQGLEKFYNQLTEIVPDISKQYSSLDIDNQYLVTNVRGLHSFQISLLEKVMNYINKGLNETITVVDIGDSSGTHLQYIKSLYPNIKALSVNIDEKAVEKIRNKGLDAIHARAEDLESYSVHADIFLSFEMLEHLSDPINFLYKLSTESKCKSLAITVPYLAQSRVGLHHIRQLLKTEVSAETTHIFELSPADWKLIFMHSGWSIYYDKIYLQYPSHGLLRLTKSLWKKVDFEGFYGAVLIRDTSFSKLYKDW